MSALESQWAIHELGALRLKTWRRPRTSTAATAPRQKARP